LCCSQRPQNADRASPERHFPALDLHRPARHPRPAAGLLQLAYPQSQHSSRLPGSGPAVFRLLLPRSASWILPRSSRCMWRRRCRGAAQVVITSLPGLRDRALIGLMVYTFARVGAVVSMRVEDYFVQGRRGWVRLHEKGGKEHEMPAHHNLDRYLEEHIAGAGIAQDRSRSGYPAESRRAYFEQVVSGLAATTGHHGRFQYGNGYLLKRSRRPDRLREASTKTLSSFASESARAERPPKAGLPPSKRSLRSEGPSPR
jgi:integrase